MIHLAHLWLFFVLVFGIIALPGLDMAFVLGSALAGGRRRGLAALAGIVAGGVCHVIMATLGISVLIRVLPGAYETLLIAGALYLAWIGASLLRSQQGFGAGTDRQAHSTAGAFRQGMLTCLLNPKAYLFSLAVFPQFLRPEYGPIWIQAAMMWLIIAFNQISVYGVVALTAGRARGWLLARPDINLLAMRCVGVLLIAAALLTGFEGLGRSNPVVPATHRSMPQPMQGPGWARAAVPGKRS